jgi:hypothetical protein
MSMKLPDNFHMCEHSWPYRFHINYDVMTDISTLAMTSLAIAHALQREPCAWLIRDSEAGNIRKQLWLRIPKGIMSLCVHKMHSTVSNVIGRIFNWLKLASINTLINHHDPIYL